MCRVGPLSEQTELPLYLSLIDSLGILQLVCTALKPELGCDKMDDILVWSI